MVWLVVVALVCVGGAILVVQRRRMGREVEQIRAEAREVKVDVEREARATSKRLKREHQRALVRAEHGLLRDLLPLIDALDAAVETSQADAAATIEGLELVRRQLEKVLESHGVSRIFPEHNQEFDPELHEGVEVIEVEGVEEGRIALCRRVGFKQGDDVLRAAIVAVGASISRSDESGSTDVSGPDEESVDAVEVERVATIAES